MVSVEDDSTGRVRCLTEHHLLIQLVGIGVLRVKVMEMGFAESGLGDQPSDIEMKDSSSRNLQLIHINSSTWHLLRFCSSDLAAVPVWTQ